MYKVNAVVVQ